MKFLRLGDLVINLDTVNTMELQTWDNRICVRIVFSGEHIHRIYQDRLGIYDELVAWIQRQPQIDRDMKP
jgi:hypothetical protein